MKKRSLKSLKLNRTVVSTFSLNGGRKTDPTTSNTGTYLTADVKDCPHNTLADDCHSLGACG